MSRVGGSGRAAVAMVGCAAALAAALWPGRAAATTYRVGPGQPHQQLQDVADSLGPGDVVELQGGVTYEGGIRLSRHGSAEHRIIIRGVRKGAERPVIHGGDTTLEAAADHYVFEGLELTGGRHRCFFHHANDITLRDSVIRDCPSHGVLGADHDSGTLVLEYSEIFRCGDGLRRHAIYIATDQRAHPGSIFRMQHCYVHDGQGGNNVKSRAERNEIYFNWIEGAPYHELELIGPEVGDPGAKREDSDVVGNVFVKHNDAYTVRVGGDGTGETNGRYRFVHNTFLLAPEHRPVFRIFDGIESIEMHNNVLFRRGGGAIAITRTQEAKWSTGQERIAGRNNWIPQGSTAVPAGWSGTIVGTDPGWMDLDRFDLRPAPTSPLIDAAVRTPPSPAGFEFPSPLTGLSSQPPPRRAGISLLRTEVGAKPDIGAYEGGAPFQPMEPVPATGSGAPPSLGPARSGQAGTRCGCRLVGVSPSRSGPSAVLWLGLLATGLAARRRRRQDS